MHGLDLRVRQRAVRAAGRESAGRESAPDGALCLDRASRRSSSPGCGDFGATATTGVMRGLAA